MMRFQGKSVLVTGAGSTRGIGRAIAMAFAAEGAHVACFDRNATGCRSTAKAISKAGGSAIAIIGDVSRSVDVRRAIKETIKQHGNLDVLVNNAAIASFKPLIEVTEKEWDRMTAVNLKGYFLFCKEGARHMIASKTQGCIVNVSTIGATLAGENKVHYCASKAGVNLLTRGLALELGPQGIRVNSVSPGAIETDIIRDSAVEQLLAKIPASQRTPIGKMGVGGDVAPTVLFLASKEAAFVTGADILVDGGLTAGQRFPQPPKETA